MRPCGRGSCLSWAKPRAYISGWRRNGALFHFPGRVAEWFKAAVLKTARGFALPRGFESHPFRQFTNLANPGVADFTPEVAARVLLYKWCAAGTRSRQLTPIRTVNSSRRYRGVIAGHAL